MSIWLQNAKIEAVVSHWVGNKAREENMVISQRALLLNDATEDWLKKYFLKPFDHDFYQKFDHPDSLQFNTMHGYVESFFNDTDSLYMRSINMLQHLYDASTVPNIKVGEVYFCHFSGIVIDGNEVDALGIFKTEKKEKFLKPQKLTNQMMLELDEGVQIGKLDKGVLIFEMEEEDGFRCLVHDRSGKDTVYWNEEFLGVTPCKGTDNFHTDQYLKLCKDFSDNYIAAQGDKSDEVMFMKRSVEYFAENDQFDPQEFSQQVIARPDIIDEFNNHKQTYQDQRHFAFNDSFDISKAAVKKAKQENKNLIRLDTNVELKLNFNDNESVSRFLERGWDAEKHMYYYKVYFNEEED